MVYVTGDTHGDYNAIATFCFEQKTNRSDVMIILGDHGVNYQGEKESVRMKKRLSRLPITFVLIRGNHDRRPSYQFYNLEHVERTDLCGDFYVEYDFPNILHTVDGGLYRFAGKQCLAIGGAFSVDGEYRRRRGLTWFADEQLSPEELAECMAAFEASDKEEPLVLLTHTCPLRKLPAEAFLPGVDQRGVDHFMEEWFDSLYDRLKPEDRWLCGHYHIDKVDDNVRFMFNDIIEL